MTTASPTKPNVNWRAVALPAEHGGWSFLLEPLLLGLLLRPTFPGLLLAVSALGMFLARQPLKIALVDRRRGKRYARTVLAEKFLLVYGGVTVLSIAAAFALSQPVVFLPLVIAFPAMLVQLYADAQGESREALPELVSPVAIAAFAPAIALAGGFPLPQALAAWALLAARCVPSIVYVRARLRLEHGKAANPIPALAAHVAGAALAGLLALLGLAPWLSLPALLALLARAALGLSASRKPTPAKVIGIRELLYGLLVVFSLAIGYR
jgi:hypothetical protein